MNLGPFLHTCRTTPHTTDLWPTQQGKKNNKNVKIVEFTFKWSHGRNYGTSQGIVIKEATFAWYQLVWVQKYQNDDVNMAAKAVIAEGSLNLIGNFWDLRA